MLILESLTAEVSETVDSVNKAVSLTQKWLESDLIPFLTKLATAIVVLAVGWLLINLILKLLVKIINRKSSDNTVSNFVKTFVGILLKVCLLISCLAILGINVTAIITALGAAGVAVALALQSNLSNVASGLIILVTRPFRVGDYIEINGAKGTVEEIQILNTRLNTYDNKAITVPNSSITSSTLINYTSEELRRVDIDISIGYDSDVEKAKELILGVVKADDIALTEPEPIIRMGGHGESALIIFVRVWCRSENYWDLYYNLYENIKKQFDENGISIPFNQLDVHMK